MEPVQIDPRPIGYIELPHGRTWLVRIPFAFVLHPATILIVHVMALRRVIIARQAQTREGKTMRASAPALE